MSKIESFNNEKELLERIEQFKIDGVKEDTMTVVSDDKLESPSFEYTNVNFISSEGSTWDKIVSFFSSDDTGKHVLSNLDLNESERNDYKAKLDNGEILFFVEGMENEQNEAQGDEDRENSTSSNQQGVDDNRRDEPSTESSGTDDDITQSADAASHEEKISVLDETDVNIDDRGASLTTLPETEKNEELKGMPYDDGIDHVDMSKYQFEDEGEQEIVNKEMLDAPKDSTLVDTHYHPEITEEVEAEDEENEIVVKHSDGTEYYASK